MATTNKLLAEMLKIADIFKKHDTSTIYGQLKLVEELQKKPEPVRLTQEQQEQKANELKKMVEAMQPETKVKRKEIMKAAGIKPSHFNTRWTDKALKKNAAIIHQPKTEEVYIKRLNGSGASK